MTINTFCRRELVRVGAGAAAAGVALGAAPSVLAAANDVAPRKKPLVIGHRGCSALRPEHTLASYAKAIQQGADFVEPDLVSTKDGALIARHENNIAETTNVADHPEFADRRTTKVIDGESLTGWFTEDFTLAEIKTLRAVERLSAMRPESKSYDGQFQLLTLEEITDFVAAESAARGRTIGLIPEIKHPTYFSSIGLPQEQRFLDRVALSHYLSTAPVIVQSFEVANLKWLRPRIGAYTKLQLLQLTVPMDMSPPDVTAAGGKLTYNQMHTPAGLAEMKTYADWVSPVLQGIIPFGDATGKSGPLGKPSRLVRDARAAGLLVSTWTVRPENRFLPTDFQGPGGDDARQDKACIELMRRYIAAGVDSFFTDDPGLGRVAVDGMV
ncbi:glycerophosphodiester phosphodiesterase [Novosphingobium sp. P6W]|uniref:glycerophosphodiester phosphodiesterase n=1 Tax=Novosphingobium sp. P6W TaxID=1609758 RepID=UPI0005C31690|nr:glycerophosphodiester phosphodiesterase [Novosphingobium sp. P6W]AXB79809.1 glycerophosphodiester phosphodiesterase [Novosphingobium sp. P6W]KIS30680.1 glycerophosphodiester phosphodiesterase [Novosphingobium sp. P6W]